MWLGRPLATESSFTEDGAAVYVEVLEPRKAADVANRLAAGVATDGIVVTEVEPAGTAMTDTGEIDLATFAGVGDEGAEYSCLASLERTVTSTICDAGPADQVKLFWEERGVADTPSGSILERSVTVFDAPAGAASMFVLLDTGQYVGADVVGGASHVRWRGELGAAVRVVLVDAGGVPLHQQAIG